MMDNPYLARRKRIGESGRRSEKRTAKRLGATLTAASGSTRAKGDMSLGEFLIEAKSTVNQSMSVQLSWLQKIEREALAVGKTPALTVTFTLPSGGDPPGGAGRWVMIPESTFREIID
jgi:hypothetical protein